MVVAYVFSSLGTLTSVGITLTPFPAFRRAWKSRELDEISHLFLLITNLNCLAWVAFGLRSENIAIIIPNAVNICTTFMFLCWYHLIAGDILRFAGQYTMMLTMVATALFRVLTVDFVGISCVAFNFCSYAAPIEQVGVAIKEKNGKFIDMNVILACLLASILWGAFGTLTSNYYILVPNALGFLACCFQIIVFMWANDLLPFWVFGGIHKEMKDKNQVKKEEMPLTHEE